MILFIDSAGAVCCLYSEQIDLASLGALKIRRASHVEPDTDGNWWVDLAPSGGPLLGPFARRSTALHREIAWLERHGFSGDAVAYPR